LQKAKGLLKDKQQNIVKIELDEKEATEKADLL